MKLQKISVKIFSAEPNTIPLSEFIDVFHGWIQASDGVYHDVADYSHMQAGPGVVLVAKDANVAIDECNNRRGLVFMQKSAVSGSNTKVITSALRAALAHCRKLEDEPKLTGQISFSGREIAIAVNDRLLGPNNEGAFAELQAEIDAVARGLFAGAGYSLERDPDARKRLNVTLKAEAPLPISVLLESLQGQPAVGAS